MAITSRSVTPRATAQNDIYTQLLESNFPVPQGVGPLEASELSSELRELIQQLDNSSNVNDLSVAAELATSTSPTSSSAGNFADFLFTDPSMLASRDVGSNLYGLGRTIGLDPNGSNITNPSVARRGRALSIIGNTGTAVTQIAQNILAGLATQKRYQNFYDQYNDNLARAQEGSVQYLKQGGKVKMAEGGVVPVEVERGEIIRDPNGNATEVQGRTHEQGGEDMFLQVGTEIVSDNRKIGKNGVSKFKDLFSGLNLNLKPADTYADVVRKVETKIGIEKVNDDIESATRKLENLSSDDTNTYNLNSSYLRNKITRLKEEKEILETSRLKAIDQIFDVQEVGKGSDSTNISNSGSQLLNYFEQGGIITDNQLTILERKTKLPKSYLRGAVARAQSNSLKKMQDGGRVYFEQVLNQFSQPNYTSQRFTTTSANATTSGAVTPDTLTNRVNETLRIFPRAAEFLDITYSNDGTVQDVKFKNDNSVKQYQDYVNRVYNNISKYADEYVDNPQQREQLKEYVQGLQFTTDDEGSVRFTDNIFGDFTSSRSGIALPLVTREELERLNEMGINNFSQLFDETGNIVPDYLSESTSQILSDIRNSYGNDFEAVLNSVGQEQINTARDIPSTPITQIDRQNTQTAIDTAISDPNSDLNTAATSPVGVSPSQQPELSQQIVDPTGDLTGPNIPNSNNNFVLPFLPNQYRYDYDSPTEQARYSIRYGRLAPTRREYTSSIQEINSAENAAIDSLRGYADPQRLAALSNVVANTTAAINQAVTETEAWNSANRQQVDIFNISQADREADAQRAEDLRYEQSALTGLAITESNNERINNYNRSVRLGNYNTVNRLRNINNLFPNYNVDPYGSIVYNQNGPSPFVNPTQSDEITRLLEIYSR